MMQAVLADSHEDQNVVADPGNSAVVKELAQQLAAEWLANAPPH